MKALKELKAKGGPKEEKVSDRIQIFGLNKEEFGAIVVQTAAKANEEAKGMVAFKGRSKYLKEKVIGHEDPGCRFVLDFVTKLWESFYE